jgi:hypothetical protein
VKSALLVPHLLEIRPHLAQSAYPVRTKPFGPTLIEVLEADLGAGYFQPYRGQLGCLSCDSLGDFYQKLPGQTNCRAPVNTRRYPDALGTVNRSSSCECKEGATFATPCSSADAPTPAMRVQATSPEMCKWERCESVLSFCGGFVSHFLRSQACEPCT